MSHKFQFFTIIDCPATEEFRTLRWNSMTDDIKVMDKGKRTISFPRITIYTHTLNTLAHIHVQKSLINFQYTLVMCMSKLFIYIIYARTQPSIHESAILFNTNTYDVYIAYIYTMENKLLHCFSEKYFIIVLD